MWFRVDDRFWQHPKLYAIPAKQRNEAAGLWVRAGSWCGMNETDGDIPAGLPVELNATAADAARLERVGLWVRSPEGGGWIMRDWSEWNPTRAEIESRRESDRKRKRRPGSEPP